MHLLAVLRNPIVTEKSTLLQSRNKYVFEVAPKANKAQVREAVERAFDVKVVSVNITMIPGEIRRIGPRRQVKTSSTKKAIVTVKAGDTIQIFEGA